MRQYIEFLGCSGAGKTTLMRDVRRRLSNQSRTVPEAILGPSLGSLTQESLVNLLMEVMLFPRLLAHVRHPSPALCQARRILARQQHRFWTRLRLERSILRRLVLGDVLFDVDGLILVDEGPCGVPAVTFGNCEQKFAVEQICELAGLIPRPAAVILVDAPDDLLMERMLSRFDPPFSDVEPAQARAFIDRAHTINDSVIDVLSGHIPILDLKSEGNLQDDATKVVQFVDGLSNDCSNFALPKRMQERWSE